MILKSEQLKIDDILLDYDDEMFLNDIARAVDLPDYFKDKENLQAHFNNEEFKEGSMFSDK